MSILELLFLGCNDEIASAFLCSQQTLCHLRPVREDRPIFFQFYPRFNIRSRIGCRSLFPKEKCVSFLSDGAQFACLRGGQSQETGYNINHKEGVLYAVDGASVEAPRAGGVGRTVSPHPEVHLAGTRRDTLSPKSSLAFLSFPSHVDLCIAGNAWKGVWVIMVGSAFFRVVRYTS